jgi:hypothetical protein
LRFLSSSAWGLAALRGQGTEGNGPDAVAGPNRPELASLSEA